MVQDDLVAVRDSLTLVDTHLTLRGIHTMHGHLVQQLAYKRQKLNSHTLFVVIKRMFTILFILLLAFESVGIFGTWGAVGMASFHT